MTTRQQTADSKQIRKFAMHLIHKVTGSTYFVGFPIIFLRMLNHDHKAALLLNQILYWCERTKHPEGWFYKTYDEWNEELGLSAAEIRRIVKGDKRVKDPKSVLGDYGVETAVKRAPDGSPTVHYRIDQEIFLKKLMDHLHVDPNPTDKLMIFENEQCLVSKMNNVEDGKSTMFTFIYRESIKESGKEFNSRIATSANSAR